MRNSKRAYRENHRLAVTASERNIGQSSVRKETALRVSAFAIALFLTTALLASIPSNIPTLTSSKDDNDMGYAIGSLVSGDQPRSVNHRIIGENNLLQDSHIPFIPNLGQTDDAVKFYADFFGGTAFVTNDGITYALIQDSSEEMNGYAIREIFIGKQLNPYGTVKSKSIQNYLIGDKSNWKSNIATYDEISLGEPWNGVQVSLKSYGNNIEKIFTISPHTNTNIIRMEFSGIPSLDVDSQGQLVLKTPDGLLYMTNPISYQEVDGKMVNVNVRYTTDGTSYGFAVGKHNPNYELIIDPLLGSTYLGGSSDTGGGIAIDSSGYVYVWGSGGGLNFPTTVGAYDTSLGHSHISKFSPDLKSLIASTLFASGSGSDYSIAIDASDNVFVAGFNSNVPATPGAYDTTASGGADAFVSKFNSDLTSLLASTYLGGSGVTAYGITIDSSDNVYVTGFTSSTNFPTTLGAYDTTANGGGDAFVSKFNSDLTSLLASTYLGGSSGEYAYGIEIDPSGNVYVEGPTGSSDFPTTVGAYDTTYNGGTDAFVSKFNSDLTSLLASTYLGGSNTEASRSNGGTRSIAIDSSGAVYVVGTTSSPSTFPTTAGAYDTTPNGGQDAFVSKFNSDLTSLLASTYLGGSGGETAPTIALDSSDNVYVTGSAGINFPTTLGAYDTTYASEGDAFISKFNSDLTSLLASTYLGGSVFHENPTGIALDSTGAVYIAGELIKFGLNAPDFPTTVGAYDTTYNGGKNAFVSKLSGDLSGEVAPSPTEISINDVSLTEGDTDTKNFDFTVTRSGDTTGTSTVDFATDDDSAASPSDYTTIPLTPLSFAADETTKTITVVVNGDATDEPDETFNVNLSNCVGCDITGSQGVGTIQNDDSPLPTDTIPPVVTPPDNQVAQATSSAGAVVNYPAATAVDDVDGPLTPTCEPASGSTFPLGITTVNCTVTDAAGNVGEASFTVTVLAEPPTEISVNDVSLTEGDSGTKNFDFTVTRSGDTSSTSTVDYVTADDTASSPTDYAAIPITTLSFAADETTKTITVVVSGDTDIESDESFIVSLSDCSGCDIVDSEGLATIENDDDPGPGNQPPTADAGPDQDVTEGALVTLDGSASSDPDDSPSPLTHSWVQTVGTAATLSDANIVNPSFTSPEVGPAGETLTFELTVSDGEESRTDAVNVTVNDDDSTNQCDNDDLQPLVSITSLNKIAPTTSGATFRIEGTATDNGDGCGVEKVEIKVKDPITFALFIKYEIATPAATDDWSTWTHEITLEEERDYSIVARATDNAGNKNWFLNTFTVDFDAEDDETRPTVSITSPEKIVTITGPSSGVTLDLEGTAFDSGRGVANVQIKINDPTTFQLLSAYEQASATGPEGEDDYSTWEKQITFEEEGTYRLTARAIDEAGNRNWSHVLVKVEFD